MITQRMISNIWDEGEPDPEEVYDFFEFGKAVDLTKLMKLVVNPETNNNINKFKKFVSECTKEYINRQNSKGWSAVHMFCQKSRIMNSDILKILIDAGANIDLKDNNGGSSLMFVSEFSGMHSTESIVKILIDAGANLDLQDNDGWSALMVSSSYSNAESTELTVKMLIDAGASLNLRNTEGCTSLILAASHSNTISTELTVNMLIKAGADLNLQNNGGWTALMVASVYSDTQSTEETVKTLIEARANLDLRNEYGMTALMLSLGYSRINMDCAENAVKMLIEAGANSCLLAKEIRQDNSSVIIKCDNNNVIKMLVDVNTDLNPIEYCEENDIEYFLDNGYSIYHPSFLKISSNKYEKYIEPKKRQIRDRNTMLKMELSANSKHIKFNSKTKATKLISLKSSSSNISEDEFIKTLKEEGIWELLSIRDKEDMHQKISDYLKYCN